MMSSPAHQLMFSLIDYAGLFPPAGLEMRPVVENFAKYLSDSDFKSRSHSLSRLVVPAARLSEFAEVAADLLPKKKSTVILESESPWLISGLVPPSEPGSEAFEKAVQMITEFNQRHSNPSEGMACVDRVELKAPSIEHIETAAAWSELPVAFLELPHDEVPLAQITRIAELTAAGNNGLKAKIRTGGVTPDLIPSPEKVARFIHCCAEHKVGFKATAGLHHPIRGEYNLTYEPDSQRATMHGFTNVFLASIAAFSHGASVDQLISILEIQSADQIEFSDGAVRVGGFEITADQVLNARVVGISSFGSCSFEEPTAEFKSLFGCSV